MKSEVRYFWIIVGTIAMVAGVFIFQQTIVTNAEIDSQLTLAETMNKNLSIWEFKNQKHAPIKVKGLYLTAYSAGNSQKINEIITFISSTEINAVVIDIKDYSGYILYDSQLPFVNNNQIQARRALA